MSKGNSAEPSPFRSGLLHGLLSITSFAAIAGFLGAGVHLAGDADAAGPRIVVALFDGENGRPAQLKDRFASPTLLSARVTMEESEGTEPNLGIADPGNTAIAAASAERLAAAPSEARGLRINGRTVLPGQSFSQVDQTSSTASEGTTDTTGRIKTVSLNTTPEFSAPANPNASPFENPDGKPVVALVIGGLGTSYRQSLVAIDDLPTGVTLSFIPDASSDLLRKARRKGHETLAELPMEAHSNGRTRPHQNTLTAAATEDENANRLRATLRNKPGIYGVVSYNGSKFAGDGHAVSAVASDLADRGLAFVQHANLNRTMFETHADSLDMPYAAATVNIDSRPGASDIERALLTLESQAMETGYALGTGFAYPITVDVVRDWATRLEDKGILLAPVSVVTAMRERPVQTTQLTGTTETAQP
ncbi:MAG: divergent polysaccharide deacetylase family protein [Pseudomonadota bacterium]